MLWMQCNFHIALQIYHWVHQANFNVKCRMEQRRFNWIDVLHSSSSWNGEVGTPKSREGRVAGMQEGSHLVRNMFSQEYQQYYWLHMAYRESVCRESVGHFSLFCTAVWQRASFAAMDRRSFDFGLWVLLRATQRHTTGNSHLMTVWTTIISTQQRVLLTYLSRN